MGLSVPIPVFDRNQGGTLEARYRLAKAEQERQASRVRVRTALARAYAELSASFAEATSLKNNVLPGARSAFEAAGEAFQQGKFGYLDVLDAQRTLFEATAQYIEALTSFHKAAADVELLVGVPLDAIENPA
jgi:cobalt-zinc-cadmium efflux system outer membrane protein